MLSRRWQLVRALRAQVHEMTTQLDWLERQSLTNFSTRRAATLRLEIAALRRDINEAQMFISRLQRRYLADNGRRPRKPTRAAPSSLTTGRSAGRSAWPQLNVACGLNHHVMSSVVGQS